MRQWQPFLQSLVTKALQNPAFEAVPPVSGFKYSLGVASRLLPRSWTLGKRYAEFQALAKAGESWSVDQIREYQAKQLRTTLIQAGNHCPYYQRTFAQAGFRPELVRGPEDLRDCPMLEKTDLALHLPQIVSTVVPARHRLYFEARDGPSEPLAFCLQKGVSLPKDESFLQAMWRRVGYGEGARVAVIGGGAPAPGGGGRSVHYDAFRNWLVLASDRFTEELLPESLRVIESFKPGFLQVEPSVALRLAGYLESEGQAWRWPLRALLCGGEGITAGQKSLLERIFRCRVYHWYGQSERVVLAGAGAESELLYFFPHYGLVEFGPPNEQGLHEVIGTSFHNLAMPLVRYRTGDYVRLADPRTDGDLEFPWPAAAFPPRLAGLHGGALAQANP